MNPSAKGISDDTDSSGSTNLCESFASTTLNERSDSISMSGQNFPHLEHLPEEIILKAGVWFLTNVGFY